MDGNSRGLLCIRGKVIFQPVFYKERENRTSQVERVPGLGEEETGALLPMELPL